MLMSQKDAVVNFTLEELKSTSFQSGKDDALTLLTNLNLENIKNKVYHGIMNGHIQYGKSIVSAEVRAYSRSVTMNHLKKAKELNGGKSASTTNVAVSRVPKAKKSAINFSSIPADLRQNLNILLGENWEN